MIEKGKVFHFRSTKDGPEYNAVCTGVDVHPGVIVISYIIDPDEENHGAAQNRMAAS